MYQQRFQHHNRKPQPYAQERDSTIVCARAREYPLPWRSLQSAPCLFEKELLDRTQLDALLEEALDRCNAVGHSGQQNNPEQDLWIRWKKELMDGVRRTPELGALFLDCLTEMASSHSKSLFLHTRDILRMCHDHCLARVTWEKALRDRTSRPFRVEFTMPELRPLVEWYGLVSHQEHARNPLAFRDLPVMTMTDLVWLLADYFKLGFFASYSLQQAPAKQNDVVLRCLMEPRAAVSSQTVLTMLDAASWSGFLAADAHQTDVKEELFPFKTGRRLQRRETGGWAVSAGKSDGATVSSCTPYYNEDGGWPKQGSK